MQVLLEQLSMSKSHLVHISIDVNKFHKISAFTDLMELAVRMSLEQGGWLVPDRLVVSVVGLGSAVAVGSQNALHAQRQHE